MKIATSFLVLLFAVITSSLTLAQGADRDKKPETPHLTFVTEYVDELGAFENIRARGEKEFNEENSKGNQPFTVAIHNSTLTQLELRTRMATAATGAPILRTIPRRTA